MDSLINNKFAEKIEKLNEKDNDILKIIESLTEEFKGINIKDLEIEKFESNLYTNNGSNINEFYATVFKAGMDFLTCKNDDYLKAIEKKNKILNGSDNKKTVIYIIVISVLSVVILGTMAYFLGKKMNENRKKRANELNDEDFEYSTSDSINSIENSKEKNTL